MNNLLEVAGWFAATKERRRLLECLLEKPTGPVSVSRLAAEARASKGLASLFLGKLRKAGLLEKTGSRLSIDLRNPLVRLMKQLINVSAVDLTLLKKLHAKTVLLYGSWAEGTNNEGSDVDLCILTKKPVKEEEIALVEGELSRRLGVDVHVLALDAGKRARLREQSPAFYFSLAYKSILLEGEPLEA